MGEEGEREGPRCGVAAGEGTCSEGGVEFLLCLLIRGHIDKKLPFKLTCTETKFEGNRNKRQEVAKKKQDSMDSKMHGHTLFKSSY